MKTNHVGDWTKKCALIAACAIILSGCSSHPGISDKDWDAAQQQVASEYQKASEEMEAKTAATEEVTTEASTAEVTEVTEVTEADGSDGAEVESGQHEIGDVTIFFTKHVNDDVTGNWRVATTTTTKSAEEYAADYYKECFASDDEIHGICNLTLKTTARVTVLDSDTLTVTIMEYKDGEEHSAKELFGGMVLGEYQVSISTGAVTEVKE